MKMRDISYKIAAWSFLLGSSTCSNVIQLKRKKKLTDKWQAFPSTQSYAIKFVSMKHSATKMSGDRWLKKSHGLPAQNAKLHTRLWAKKNFSPKDWWSKSLHFPLERRVEHSLKSPSSAHPQHHGFGGDQVVMGGGCCDSCQPAAVVVTV